MRATVFIQTAIAGVVALSTACAPADEPSTSLELTLENIVGTRARARSARLSPDGAWVAVSAMGDEGPGIYLVGTEDDVEGARLWVQGRSPTWFPDSRRIAFLRDGDIWTIGREGDESRVTEDEAGERAPVVAPDGSHIAFYSGRSGHQDIWVVDAEGGEARPVTSEAYPLDDARWAPAWSPDSREIAYVSNRADFWADDIWVVDLASGTSRQLSSRIMASSTPVWSPQGDRIALLATWKDDYWYEDLADLVLLDPAGGTEQRVSMQVYATDWLHNMSLVWSGDGARLYFVYQERGDFDIWSVASSGGVATRVTNIGGALSSFSASAGAEAFALVRATPTRGPDVDYVQADGGVPLRLTSFAPSWRTVVDPVEISYRTFDGLYIQGFLYMPPDHMAGERRPTLVNVHGGGTNAYLHGEGLTEQYLASKGYVVLAINYRGGSGFGRTFQDLSINDWANDQARDAAAAADFLRAQPYSNGQVGIYGYSYGGIMTMAAIARAPEAFDAAVPMAGIYDFGDAYTNADRVGRIFIRTGHGGSPEERPEVYAISNTLARLEQVETPMLVMHGELDVRAPFRQYELAVADLERFGKDFESRSYPGERHGLRPDARIDMYRRMEAFFEERLER